jgi:hypothetical protein
MSDTTMDSSWMDEKEPGCQNVLTCHIEIDMESGDTFRQMLAKAAASLLTIAPQLETGWFDDGWHPITTPGGEQIGAIYLDYSGHMEH